MRFHMGDESAYMYLALFLSVTFTPSCLYQRNTTATVCLIVGYVQPIERLVREPA